MSRRPKESIVFAWLVLLFPRDFRDRYGDDMRDLLQDQLNNARRRSGTRGVIAVWLSTLSGVPIAAARAHRDALFPQLTSVDRTRRSAVLEQTMNDLRFALRLLRKSPIFALVAVLAISLGAGAVTTIFSAMNAIVLRPVPGVASGARVIGLEFHRRDGQAEQTGTYPTYTFLRDRSETTSGVGAWAKATLTIAANGRDAARVVTGSYASGNYFSVLGVRPALGRFFLPEEDRTPLANPVIVVSYDFWTTTLGADSSMIGKPLSVNGNPYTLIGVAPKDFRGLVTLIPVDGWIPIMMQGQLQPERKLESATWLRMFARLRDGRTAESADAELSTLFMEQNQATPANRAGTMVGIHVSPQRSVPEDARKLFLGFMAILLAAATFVLFIASVNVAAMLSARAVARRREMAVRAALGASRARLVAQMLTEVLVLFGIGAAGAVAIAFGATRWATRFPLPAEIIVPPDLVPDARVMTFALLVSLLTGLVFGLMPALNASRDNVSARLRDGTTGAGTKRSWIGNALITGQLALSLVLLVAAGLFVRALDRAAGVDPGFDRHGVTVVSLDTRTWGYDDVRGRQFYHAVRDRMSALPGVTSVSMASFAPLTTRSLNDSVTLASGQRAFTWYVGVSQDYFRTLGMAIVAGRPISSTDDARAPLVAVVNETFARRLAPNGGALGQTFMRGKQPVTVVGIARDAKYATFDETTPSMMFLPIDQAWQSNQTMLVSGLSPAQLAGGLHDIMRAIDPLLPVPSQMTLDRASGITVLPQRIALVVTGTLGGIGLVLAVVGLYGVIAYSVNRRTREIGVRLALGASRTNVLALVLGDGLRLATVGVVVGLVLSAAATRVIAGLLFDVSALDAVTFFGMSLLLVAVAVFATYIPARRAARLDPMSALRSD